MQLKIAEALAEEIITAARIDNRRTLALSPGVDPRLVGLTKLPESLTELTHLRELRITAPVEDLTVLSRLPYIRALRLNRVRTTDLSPIRGMQGLVELKIVGFPLEDISPLSDLPKLSTFSAPGSKIRDLSPLSGSTTLSSLNISSTEVENLEPICRIKSLRELIISNSRVRDLAPLLDLPSLEVIKFRNIPPTAGNEVLNDISRIESPERRRNELYLWLEAQERRREKERDLPSQHTGGVRFELSGDFVEPLVEGEVGPLASAMLPSVVEALEILASPLVGSNQAPEPGHVAKEILSLLREDLSFLHAKSYRLWALSQRLGRTRERDIAAQTDRTALSTPLSPEIREALDNVVDVLPVFARQFPLCRALDDEKARWARDNLVESCVQSIISDARSYQIIRTEVADELKAFAPSSDRGVQSDKIARSGVFTARNLVYAAVGVIATASITAITTEIIGGVTDGIRMRSTITARTAKWFGDKPDNVLQVIEGAPADVRAAVTRHVNRAKEALEKARSRSSPEE